MRLEKMIPRGEGTKRDRERKTQEIKKRPERAKMRSKKNILRKTNRIIASFFMKKKRAKRKGY